MFVRINGVHLFVFQITLFCYLPTIIHAKAINSLSWILYPVIGADPRDFHVDSVSDSRFVPLLSVTEPVTTDDEVVYGACEPIYERHMGNFIPAGLLYVQYPLPEATTKRAVGVLIWHNDQPDCQPTIARRWPVNVAILQRDSSKAQFAEWPDTLTLFDYAKYTIVYESDEDWNYVNILLPLLSGHAGKIDILTDGSVVATESIPEYVKVVPQIRLSSSSSKVGEDDHTT